MSKATIFMVVVLASSLFLSESALAQDAHAKDAYANSNPAAEAEAAQSRAKDREDHSFREDASKIACPVAHTTLLVRLFGDALCPIGLLKSIRVIS